MGWLSGGYLYRKPLVLTGGASGALVDFQLDISIAHVSGKIQADFDDLRFTQADGTTTVDAWLESKVDSTSAEVWVEFPTTPANTVEQEYFMYYGKVGAVSDWDGDATFLFFDDFESALSGWTASAERGATAYEGSYGVHTAVQNKHPAHAIIENNICIEAKVRQSGRSGIHVRTTQSPEPDGANGVGYQLFNKLDGNIYIYEQSSGYIATEPATNPTTGWYNWKFCIDGSDMKGKYWADGTSEPAWMISASDATVASGGIGFYGYSTGTYCDLIRVSKYATNPPTYAFGAEESEPFIPQIIMF